MVGDFDWTATHVVRAIGFAILFLSPPRRALSAKNRMVVSTMSALGQKRTFSHLVEHLVSSGGHTQRELQLIRHGLSAHSITCFFKPSRTRSM